MIPRTDRGVSEVFGAILIFAFLVLAFAGYQATVVPQQNGEVEFNAYQSARTDLVELQNNLVAAGLQGFETGTIVQTGAQYPARTFAINPGPPLGRLTTGPGRNVSFTNVSAIAAEHSNTREFWDSEQRYVNVTSGIVFEPDYNQFDGQPVGVTGESVYTIGDNQLAAVTGQSLITRNRLQLVFIDGELDNQGMDVSVTATPQSSATRTVAITGQGGPLTLRLDPPPRTTANEWIATYGQSLVSSNPRVVSVENSSGQIELKLDRSRIYLLQLSRVTVGTGDLADDDEAASYIIAKEGNESLVGSGKRAEIAAEVRDRFNNPVAGTTVTFEIMAGDATFIDQNGSDIGSSTTTVETDSTGRAPQAIRVESITEDVLIEARINDGTGVNVTTFRVQTPNEDNPVQLAGVRFEGGSRTGNNIELTFSNQISADREIQRFRLNFYQGGDPDSGTIEGQSFTVGGSGIELDPTLSIPAGSTEIFTIDFDSYNPSSGDWFVITVQYDTGDTAQYFANVD